MFPFGRYSAFSGPILTDYALLILFFLTWTIAGAMAARTVARPKEGQESLYLWINIAGFALLFSYFGPRNAFVLWRLEPAVQWALVGVTVLGFAFCWWARLHLGKLWSASVTRKEGHRIIDTGPYGLVRHPIYTGMLVSCIAFAVLNGSALSLLGAGLTWLAFFIKARLEERFLKTELGEAAYAGYQARTPMLVPFWPAR